MKAVSNNYFYQVDFTGGGYILRRSSTGLDPYPWAPEGVAQTLPTGISFVTDFGNTLTFNPNSSTTPGVTASITLLNTKGTKRIVRVYSSTGRITNLQ